MILTPTEPPYYEFCDKKQIMFCIATIPCKIANNIHFMRLYLNHYNCSSKYPVLQRALSACMCGSLMISSFLI